MCQTSAKLLSGELSNILNLYKEIQFQETEDQLTVVGALVILISNISPQTIPSAIQILNQNTIEKLKLLLSSPNHPNLQTTVLNCIQIFNAGVSLPQELTLQSNISCFPLDSLLPFFYSYLTVWQNHEEIASSLCNSFVSLIYLEKTQIISHLGTLFTRLLECLANTKLPCFLKPFTTSIRKILTFFSKKF